MYRGTSQTSGAGRGGGGGGSTKCQGKKGGENWSKLCRVWNRLGDPSVLTHFLDGID